MNTNEMPAIRELSAQELDQVNGGMILEAIVIGFAVSCALGGAFTAIGDFWEWLTS